MIIAILGATGLTGNLCLHYLLNEPKLTKIIAIGRKSTGIQHKKLAEVLLVNNQLYEPVVADVLISCGYYDKKSRFCRLI
jgi:N-acetyl-gamma-glutamylphosphate reductase